MHESFGARMRHHRERQGISIATIAQQTKVKASLIEALERDDISQWPSGIFRRAYVRSYAQVIGLDADLIARQFLEIHPEPEEPIELPPEPPARLRSLVGSALGSLSLRRRGARVERQPEPPAEGTSGRTMEAEPPAPAPPPPAPDPVVAPVLTPAPGVSRIKSNVDLMAAARLCTELGRISDASALPPLLREAARIVEARGLIVWLWDDVAGELRPAAAHGYSDKLLQQLAGVKRDADNPTAHAFRTGRPRAVAGSDEVSAALVVPVITAEGCTGALAFELPAGREQMTSVRAVATVFAAMLALLTGSAMSAQTTGEPPGDAAAGAFDERARRVE